LSCFVDLKKRNKNTKLNNIRYKNKNTPFRRKNRLEHLVENYVREMVVHDLRVCHFGNIVGAFGFQRFHFCQQHLI